MTDTLIPIVLSLIGVVVHPSGATYRYSGVVPLRKGQATYVWAGLPPSADLNSLRVGLSPGSKGYIVRRQIENTPGTWQAEPPDLAILRRKLDSLEMNVAQYRRRLQLVMMQENILSSNVDLGGEKGVGVTPELVERYLQFVERRLPPLLEEKEKLQRTLNAWEDSLERWKEAYEARRKGLAQARRALHITCWSPTAENAALRVELFVPDAQWSLHYLVRAFPGEQKILLQRRALVSNRSGDDWVRVGLSLSTSAPHQSVEMPAFRTWYVDEVAPFVRRTLRRLYSNGVEVSEPDEEEAGGDEGEKTTKEPAPEAPPEPSVLNQTLTRLYELGTQTVLAGTSSVQFLLREDTFPAQFQFFVNAPAEAKAYLRAALDPSILSLWENAPTTVEVEGQEIGNTEWKAQVEGDTVWVDLGPSQVIRVERRELLNRRERRLIGGEIVHRFVYELKLSHSYPTPIKITVWDRIPVSRSSEIKVELEDVGEARLDPVTGKLTWEVVLPPDKPWQKKFRFSLRYPKDKVVYGL